MPTAPRSTSRGPLPLRLRRRPHRRHRRQRRQLGQTSSSVSKPTRKEARAPDLKPSTAEACLAPRPPYTPRPSRRRSMHSNHTADLVLERLPNGEHALLRPESEDDPLYVLTDQGRRDLALAQLFD